MPPLKAAVANGRGPWGGVYLSIQTPLMWARQDDSRSKVPGTRAFRMLGWESSCGVDKLRRCRVQLYGLG